MSGASTLWRDVQFDSCGRRLWGGVRHASARADRALTFVLSHGLTNDHDDAPLFSQLQRALLAEGHDIFLFDYLGSGRSVGCFEDKVLSELRQNLADAIGVAVGVCRTGPQSIGLFGRSVGGSLAAFNCRHPDVFTSVLVSTPLDLEATFRPTFTGIDSDGFVYLDPRYRPSGQLRGEYRLRPEFFDELESLTDELSDAITGASRVLVVQGDSDEKLDPGQAGELYQRLAHPKRYVVVEGGGHNYVGVEDAVVDIVLEWVRDVEAHVTPSGPDTRGGL